MNENFLSTLKHKNRRKLIFFQRNFTLRLGNGKIWLKMEHSNWFKCYVCHTGRGFFYINATHAHTHETCTKWRDNSHFPHGLDKEHRMICSHMRVFVIPFHRLFHFERLSVCRRVFVPISKPFVVSCGRLFHSTIHSFMYSDSHKIHLLLIEVQLRKDILGERKSIVKLYVMFR